MEDGELLRVVMHVTHSIRCLNYQLRRIHRTAHAE